MRGTTAYAVSFSCRHSNMECPDVIAVYVVDVEASAFAFGQAFDLFSAVRQYSEDRAFWVIDQTSVSAFNRKVYGNFCDGHDFTPCRRNAGECR
jgi:hypothetical protein